MPETHRITSLAAAVAGLAIAACDPFGEAAGPAAEALPDGCDVLVEPSADSETELIDALVA